MPEASTIAQKTEVLSLNDSKATPVEPEVPHERQIVDAVIAIWRQDPSTEALGVSKLHGLVKSQHPGWLVLEKRIKTLLKKFGLATSSSQFTYASDITLKPTPDFDSPPKIHLVMTAKRGKGLYAKNSLTKGLVLWSEPSLFNVPPLSKIRLIRLGKAYCYCGKLMDQTALHAGRSILRGLDCNVCLEMWCLQSCKKADKIHLTLKHSLFNPSSSKKKAINALAFHDLESYVEKEQWNALYAITYIYAEILGDSTGAKGRQFAAMARVSQEIRHKALDLSAGSFDSAQGGALFVQEQQESLWQEGYRKFAAVFPSAEQSGDLSYQEYLYMMGTYNINNVDSCIYLTQSHLNHNCSPNVLVEFLLDSRANGLSVIAARDIAAGEELTTLYVNPAHTVQQRQRELRVNWGFMCGCSKCKLDLQAQQRRKSSGVATKDKAAIREMLSETKTAMAGEELEIPVDYNGERRKSVRFDEKVIAVSGEVGKEKGGKEKGGKEKGGKEKGGKEKGKEN